jgi:hypothetical protein
MPDVTFASNKITISAGIVTLKDLVEAPNLRQILGAK